MSYRTNRHEEHTNNLWRKYLNNQMNGTNNYVHLCVKKSTSFFYNAESSLVQVLSFKTLITILIFIKILSHINNFVQDYIRNIGVQGLKKYVINK